MGKGYLELPPIVQEDFNRLWGQYFPGDGLRWEGDDDKDGAIDPGEVEIANGSAELGDYLDGWFGPYVCPSFTSLFDDRYRQIIELRRQELVRAEVAKTTWVPMVTDFGPDNLPPDEREMIKHILKAGRVMEDLFQMQLGSYPFREQLLQSGTDADRALMARYQQPWCESNPDPLCNGLATFTPHINPMAPEGLSQEEAAKHGELLLTPFTVVERGGDGQLQAIPYAQAAFGPKMAEAAEEMVAAADYAERIGERHLATYMRRVADALRSGRPFPYVASDEAWYEMKGHSKYYLRVGPDEVQWDKWQKKAGFQMIFGRIDQEAAKSVELYTAIRQQMEEAFAGVIGAPYAARKVEIELPDFVNVVMENGDMRGSVNGTAAAQTLPNQCGEDGKEQCKTRIMLFFNKTQRTYSPEVMARFGQLLDPANMQHMDLKGLTGGMVDHEFAHNLGPRQSLPAEDGRPLEQHIGACSLFLEELKAQTGSLFINGWLGEQDKRSEEEVLAGYTAEVLWMFGQLRRGLTLYRQGKFHETQSPYQQLAAVQLGYLQEKGAVTFDSVTQRFSIDYDRMHGAVTSLLREVGQLYLRHDSKEIEAFFQKYTKGPGLASLQMPAIDRAIGTLPSNLYDWQVRGIE